MNVRIVSVTEPPRVHVRGYVNDHPFLYRERERVASLRIGKRNDHNFPSVFTAGTPVFSIPIEYPSVTEREWRELLTSLIARANYLIASCSPALDYDKIGV